MLTLPSTTEYNKRIPKQKFYDNLSVTPQIKKMFVEQIKTIYWKNKIASTTTNLHPGKNVSEIEVFEIHLESQELSEKVLQLIDREIPYHIIFLLECNNQYQVWIGYKEPNDKGDSFKVTSYYHTDWESGDHISFKLCGNSMDEAYESFVRQIAGNRLFEGTKESTLSEDVRRQAKIDKIQKEIDKLEAATRKETQPKLKFDMYQQIQVLKKELERLT